MPRKHVLPILLGAALAPAQAAPFVFDSGNLDGRLAAVSRPDGPGRAGVEAADDFTLTSRTLIGAASFTGLLPPGTSLSGIAGVGVEIYRVFPDDSDLGRTSGPPGFSTSRVPTRANSPSDVALEGRGAGTLTFGATLLSPGFTALNSVQAGGINPSPNQRTGGNGPVAGQLVRLDIAFTTPLDLAADHYFLVPQVALAGGGDFLWLSSVRPIIAPGTPFAPDLQAWIRDGLLNPDWLRIGTDIIGGTPAPTFNLAFSLRGETLVPEPASLALFLSALAGLGLVRRPRRVA